MEQFLWNNRELKPPPINTYKVVAKIIDLNKLSPILLEAVNFMTNQTQLETEAKYLSGIIYRMNRKFRNDIGFRLTKKTHSALRKYFQTDFLTDLKCLSKCIPSEYDQEGTYLPTRQMVQYVLIRLQALTKFMSRILTCCEASSRFYKDRINRGQSWNVSLIALAIHSRIWSNCRELCLKSMFWYTNLLACENKFQIKGPVWLPENYEFPKDLQEWLGINLGNEAQKFMESIPVSDIDILDITEDEDVEFCFAYDEDCQIVKTEKLEKQSTTETSDRNDLKSKLQTNMGKVAQLDNIDMGESISRSNLETPSTKDLDKANKVLSKIPNKIKQTQNIKDKSHNISSIRSPQDLLNFLKQEEKYRSSNSKQAISSKLGVMQWHALQNRMQVFIKKLNARSKKPNKDNEVLLEKIRNEWESISR